MPGRMVTATNPVTTLSNIGSYLPTVGCRSPESGGETSLLRRVAICVRIKRAVQGDFLTACIEESEAVGDLA